jgi:hypothetical protein
MKYLALLSFWSVLIAVGCTANDKTAAGLEGSLNAPPAPPVSADNRHQTSTNADPAANGGYNLPPTAPYQGGSTVSQTLNPAPFLVPSQVEASPGINETAQTRPAQRRMK